MTDTPLNRRMWERMSAAVRSGRFGGQGVICPVRCASCGFTWHAVDWRPSDGRIETIVRRIYCVRCGKKTCAVAQGKAE